MNDLSKKEQYHHGDLRASLLKRSAEIISEQGIEALSLRAVARDLGVSHGAPNRHFKSKADLLATLAADIWQKMQNATLASAKNLESDDPQHYLNALGRGYLRWALENKSAFQAISHPDLRRYADDDVRAAQDAFLSVIRKAVVASQKKGRHPAVDSDVLTLYTNAVPFGCAMILSSDMLTVDAADYDQEKLIEDLIALVVPLE
jgi:AcrR family transcriptional regulator